MAPRRSARSSQPQSPQLPDTVDGIRTEKARVSRVLGDVTAAKLQIRQNLEVLQQERTAAQQENERLTQLKDSAHQHLESLQQQLREAQSRYEQSQSSLRFGIEQENLVSNTIKDTEEREREEQAREKELTEHIDRLDREELKLEIRNVKPWEFQALAELEHTDPTLGRCITMFLNKTAGPNERGYMAERVYPILTSIGEDEMMHLMKSHRNRSGAQHTPPSDEEAPFRGTSTQNHTASGHPPPSTDPSTCPADDDTIHTTASNPVATEDLPAIQDESSADPVNDEADFVGDSESQRMRTRPASKRKPAAKARESWPKRLKSEW